MTTETKEQLISVYNKFIVKKGQYKLSIEELFVYGHLYTFKTFEHKVIINFDIMNDMIKIVADSKENKKRIKAAVESLEDKGVIAIEEVGKTLIISFENLGKGKALVPYEKVRTLSPADFFIYCTVAKWDNTNNKIGKAHYSMDDWAELMDKNEKTARKYIYNACDNGIIVSREGGYVNRNGKVEQEANYYALETFVGWAPKVPVAPAPAKSKRKASEKPQEAAVLPETKQMVQLPSEPVKEPVEAKQEPDYNDPKVADEVAKDIVKNSGSMDWLEIALQKEGLS